MTSVMKISCLAVGLSANRTVQQKTLPTFVHTALRCRIYFGSYSAPLRVSLPSSSNQEVTREAEGQGLNWCGNKLTQLGNVSGQHRAFGQLSEGRFGTESSCKPALTPLVVTIKFIEGKPIGTTIDQIHCPALREGLGRKTLRI